jgi:hypothetical protein
MKRLLSFITTLALAPSMAWAVSAVRSVTLPATQAALPHAEAKSLQEHEHFSATHIPAEDISAISAIMEDEDFEVATEELDSTMLTASEE